MQSSDGFGQFMGPDPRSIGDVNGSGSGSYRGGAADSWLCMKLEPRKP